MKSTTLNNTVPKGKSTTHKNTVSTTKKTTPGKKIVPSSYVSTTTAVYNNNNTMTATRTVNITKRRSLMAANEPRSENFFQQERERAEKLVKAISAKLNLSYRNTENDDGQSDDHHHHHAIEAVSRHGESVVSDMLHHIRSDNTNNNNNIDRNIILLKELLEEEAQFGFTPRMILAGVPDVILYFVRLLRDAPHGEIHVEWNKQEKENPTNNNNNNTLLDYNYAATNSHLPLSNTTHHNNYTYNNNHNSMEEIPILPLEAFLPSLVRRQENGENNKDNKNVFSSTLVDVSDLLSAKAAAPQTESKPNHNNNNNNTLFLALDALLQKCQVPLLCLSGKDSSVLGEAVSAVCGAVSGVLTQSSSLPHSETTELRKNALLAMKSQIGRLVLSRNLLSLTTNQSKNDTATVNNNNNTMDTVRLQTIKDDALNFSEMTAAVVARWEGIMNEHAPPQEDDDEKERLWLDSAKNLNHLSMEKKVNPPPAKATTSSSQKETEEEEEARLAEEERQQQAALQRREDDAKELELILQLIFDVRLLSVEKGAHSMTRKTTTLTTAEENEVIGATILAARTLSCTAPGDHCAQLCVDLLWSLALQAPTTLTRVLLYDNEEGAVEWLFLSLVNLLNQSHRSMERDLRNDLVTFFTLLLKTDGQVWREKLARYADENDNSFDEAELLNSLSPPPAATIDAINAFVLLLLDLSCGTELNAPLLSSNDDSRGNNNNSIQHAATRNPLLTQKGKKLYSMRSTGVASPTLRKSNVEFKRLAWQLLDCFAAWQATVLKGLMTRHRAAMRENSSGAENSVITAPVLPEGLVITDLCQLGLIDVLLMYVDVRCDHSAVTAWTREELILLQGEAWRCLASLITATQPLRAVDVPALKQGKTVRRERVKSDAGVNKLDTLRGSLRRGSRYVDAEDGVTRGEPPVVPVKPKDADFKLEPARDQRLSVPSLDGEEPEILVMPMYEEEEEEQEEMMSADVHFFAAGGVQITLQYIYDTPDSLEVQKRDALRVLAALLRHGGTDVKEMIACNEELLPLVTELLEGIYRTANGGETDTGKDLYLTPAAHTLALECLSLLKNIGNTAAGLVGAIHELPSLSTFSKQEDLEEKRRAIEGGAPVAVIELESTLRQKSSQIAFLFKDCGGVTAIVWWLAKCAQQGPAPLSEALLRHHMDILLYLLDLIRIYVCQCESNADDFILEGGTQALLAVVEAAAVATRALPARYLAKVDLGKVWRADAELVTEAAKGYPGKMEKRQTQYRELLIFALSVLSDLIYEHDAAKEELLNWHCHRLLRLELEGRDETHLSAVQLLLKLFEADVKLFQQDGTEEEEDEEEGSAAFGGAKMGLQLLHINVRKIVRESFKKEFIRRLLVRKLSADGGALRMEDVLLYDRYLRESEDPGVSADELLSTLGDSEKEAILEKLTLLSSFTDEECEAQRLATTEELIRSILPIGMKVYACLFSAGLEHFTPTSAHPIASSLTPADRAVLVLLVALPSLFNDEVCLAMAEVAQVFYDEPPTAEEAERAVGMRPTPTDYRCLAGLLKDVYTRSQELRQLIHLDQLSHQTRQVQLLDRFLVTRIRETRPPPVVVPLSPESSQRGMAPPLTLAQSLSTRVAAAQSHTATTAPAASLTATYNRQQTGKEEVDPYASYMQKSTPASTVPRAPKSKVELKRKKDEMIKNSLRQLPQGKQ